MGAPCPASGRVGGTGAHSTPARSAPWRGQRRWNDTSRAGTPNSECLFAAQESDGPSDVETTHEMLLGRKSMNKQRAERRRRGHRSLSLAAGLVTALGMAAPAWAQVELPRFGMIGLAQGQIAHLSAVLVEPRDASHPGCRVTASFVNASGLVLRDATGRSVSRTFTLQPQ